MNCLTNAWTAHAAELRGWLRHRTGNPAVADDLLQDLFLRALRQGERFCNVHNARAWLFEVARNLLADQLRVAHPTVELPDDLMQETEDTEAVVALTDCLPRVMSELSTHDLQGMAQADFARLKGLSLSAAKSRVQRARVRLHARMSQVCQVKINDQGVVSDFVPRAPL